MCYGRTGKHVMWYFEEWSVLSAKRIITQGHKGCFRYMSEKFHTREHTRKVCSLSPRNRQPEQWFVTGGTAGRLRITVPTAPISRPVISTFLNPWKSSWLASDLQHMPTSSKLQSPKMDFFYARIRFCLSARVRQMLKVNGAYVEVDAVHLLAMFSHVDIETRLKFSTSDMCLNPLAPDFFFYFSTLCI